MGHGSASSPQPRRTPEAAFRAKIVVHEGQLAYEFIKTVQVSCLRGPLCYVGPL